MLATDSTERPLVPVAGLLEMITGKRPIPRTSDETEPKDFARLEAVLFIRSRKPFGR
jgi:hypothetical protein